MRLQTANNITKWNQVQDVLHHDAPQEMPVTVQPVSIIISIGVLIFNRYRLRPPNPLSSFPCMSPPQHLPQWCR